MAKLETDLMKEVRSLRREVSLILRKQDLMLRALVPEVKPTKEELKIIKKRKEFGTEKELFKALR
jgi:hypothetical protein